MAKNNKDKEKTSNNSPDVQEEELSEKSDSLEEENMVLSELVKSLEEKTLRAQAEIENVRKTSQKEVVKARIYASESLAKELLSDSEADKILEVELMKDDVIQVDDFTDKHYMSNALESQNFSKKLQKNY